MHTDQKKKLKKQAHHLKPVILLGEKGLTEAVLAELEIALEHHELIKVKIPSSDQTTFKAQAVELCEKTRSEMIHTIGHTLVIYRKSTTK